MTCSQKVSNAQPWLQIFAPLARLLGLYSIKQELEELSFMYSQPKAYAAMRSHLDEVAKQQEPVVIEVSAMLKLRPLSWRCVSGAMAMQGGPPLFGKALCMRQAGSSSLAYWDQRPA